MTHSACVSVCTSNLLRRPLICAPYPSATGVVLCSAHADRLREVYTKALEHVETFKKVLTVCVGVLRQRASTGSPHLQDVLIALNYNEYYFSGSK